MGNRKGPHTWTCRGPSAPRRPAPPSAPGPAQGRAPTRTGTRLRALASGCGPWVSQTVFSWAEFMAEEPVTPKGRGRKAQAATLSMFEWAFSLEREREAGPVGAGHVHRLSFVCRSDYFSEGASTGQSDIGGRTELDYACRLACGSKSFNHLTGNCRLAKAGSDVSHPVTGNKRPFGLALWVLDW